MLSIKPGKIQRGISLLEVLISLLILSLGALGFAGLQLKGLKTTEDANYRAQATLIAQDAIERILANPSAMESYLTANSYSAGTAGSAPPSACTNAPCSAGAMATQDKAHISWTAANSLPGGRAMATQCFGSTQCVVVSWNGMDPASCITNNAINTDDESTCLVLEVIR